MMCDEQRSRQVTFDKTYYTQASVFFMFETNSKSGM